MAWFDGTFDHSEEELREKFPVEITAHLRLSENGKELAVINDFAEGTEEYNLADPKMEEDDGEYIFYHTFAGEEAAPAREAIRRFLTDGESIALFRKEEGRLFWYADGQIVTEALTDGAEGVFVLPLKRYLYPCPVCGYRTLPYLGYFAICTECGWEDVMVQSEDDVPELCGGEYSIKEYRKRYLKRKAIDPSYSWKKSWEEKADD